MGITYTQNDVWHTHAGQFNSSLTSGTLTIALNDIIVVMGTIEDSYAGASLTISNSGTDLGWHDIKTVNAGSNCYVRAWWAKGDNNGNRTVTVTMGDTTTSDGIGLHCRVHTGADTTTPVPAGNVFSGSSAANMSQSITPTASGSALWAILADWSAANVLDAGANCSLNPDRHTQSGLFTEGVILPTTQPRPDGAAFTLVSTGAGQKLSWIALEVVAQAPPPTHRVLLTVTP